MKNTAQHFIIILLKTADKDKILTSDKVKKRQIPNRGINIRMTADFSSKTT